MNAPFLVRNIDYEDLLEKFLTSSILSLLGVRLFLKITNYPQVGGGSLHIAHMLWGGLLMLMAMMTLFIYLSRGSKQLAAIVGGFGFGVFIDELGKFITRNNNYFYQPTAAIIYAIFVLIYLAIHTFKKYSHFTSQEYLINSLELLKEAVINDLDQEEKEKTLRYLSKVTTRDKIYFAVKKLYEHINTIPVPKPNIVSHYARQLKDLYYRLVRQRWFTWLMIIFFLFQAIVSFFTVFFFIFGTFSFLFIKSLRAELSQLKISDWLSLGSSAIAGIFIILGALKIARSRLGAYREFKRAMLVSIFLVQVFSFYKDQFSAFFGLLFDLLVLLALNYMIERERLDK